eukprot:6177802-Pleurochrysis_carterae.AAC.2
MDASEYVDRQATARSAKVASKPAMFPTLAGIIQARDFQKRRSDWSLGDELCVGQVQSSHATTLRAFTLALMLY